MAEPPAPAPKQRHDPLQGREALQTASLALIESTRRSVDILSRTLDPPLYSTDDCSDRLFALIKRNRHCRIRILVADIDPLRRQGHRLLALAQRVPSFVEVRQQAPRHRMERREWLISDAQAVLYREQADRDDAIISHHDPRWALALTNEFQAMWDVAEQHPDLRRLSL